MTQPDIDKIKRNNQELQEIINNSWDGIGIIDKYTQLIYVNNAFMPILGYTKKELVEKKFISLMEEKFKREFLELLNIENIDKKYKAEIDLTCIRKDNKKVYLKITISSMLNKNLFVINTKDITAQVSDDQILDDYILSMHTDLHGFITQASKAFLKLSGYKIEEILGKPLESLLHKDNDSIIFKNLLSTLEAFNEFNGNLKHSKKDGSFFWCNYKSKPVFNKYGDITGYTFLIFDITNDIIQDEEEFLKSETEFAKRQYHENSNFVSQKSKLDIMSETLQMLSHEWRQPLNIISIQAQKLELNYMFENNLDINSIVSSLENIKNEANKLSKTIGDFQKFLHPKGDKELISTTNIIDIALNNFKKAVL